ncbi:unnamed protein product [Dibothriocephalus latus]|uniref:C2H2-type domain-containing protein n=1 Tax=Dibothriocephalus latus TaxID=60516 RepID=A0A3P7LIP0_DIBLA|nr:unnamed protein product [Dibothriocephalus latus]
MCCLHKRPHCHPDTNPLDGVHKHPRKWYLPSEWPAVDFTHLHRLHYPYHRPRNNDKFHLSNPNTQYTQPPTILIATAPTISCVLLSLTCPHYDCALTLRVGLVGHLQIRHTEAIEPVPEALTYARRTCLNCPH